MNVQLLNFDILFDYRSQYLTGFWNTIQASLLGLVGSFLIGVIIAVFTISSYRPLALVGRAYVEFIRNIPLLITVFIFYAGLPAFHINLSGFLSGTIGLAVYTSAFIAEAIRAGIQSVPKGQMEAARSTGMTYVQAMRYVVLPQAIKIVLPPLGNQFLNLVKNSSILGVVAGADLMYQADLINSETFDVFSTYIFVGMFYLLLTVPLSLLVGYMEKRWSRA
jgi:putative glutamine transport system permease protein